MLIVLNGDHEIGSIVSLNYYDNSGNEIEVPTENLHIQWFGMDTLSNSEVGVELLKYHDLKQIQLLNPINSYIKVRIGEDESDIFMVYKSQNSKNNYSNSLPVVGSGISANTPISRVSGLSAKVDNVGRINQSYLLILSTAKGEYPMLPNLGCNLHKVLFNTIASEADIESIKQDLLADLSSQEPRGNILSLDIYFDYIDTILIEIAYNIRNTNISGKVIYDTKIGGELNA